MVFGFYRIISRTIPIPSDSLFDLYLLTDALEFFSTTTYSIPILYVLLLRVVCQSDLTSVLVCYSHRLPLYVVDALILEGFLL